MKIIPFAGIDGLPDPGAIYVNAVLCSALYHVDRRPFDLYASLVGGVVRHFASNKETYQPDDGVITDGQSALIVLDGTTNFFQWVSHAAGSVWPGIDFNVPLKGGGAPFAFGTPLIGLGLIEPALDAAIASIGTGPVFLAGHSLGAGAAFIYGRRLANAVGKPASTQIMTFGEPKTYDNRAAESEPDWHARLIAGDPIVESFGILNSAIDPVIFCPPDPLLLIKTSVRVLFLKSIFGLTWRHWGQPFILTGPNLVAREGTQASDVPGFNTLLLLGNLPNAELHLMDTSYLPKARQLWLLSGKWPVLSAFDSYYQQYTSQPFVPADNTGPPVSAGVLNDAYFGGPGPVTDADRTEWQAISAFGYWAPPPIGKGLGEMSFFKGTMMFNSMQGGFSESVYSLDPAETVASMMRKMQQVMQSRCKLSYTNQTPYCKNPILPFGIRVEDTLNPNSALFVAETTPRPGYPVTQASSAVDPGNQGAYQNLDLELGARVKYLGGASGQNAFVTHHGLPSAAFTNLNPPPAVPFRAFQRYGAPVQLWLDQLWYYIVTLGNLNLGFRNITGAWNIGPGSPGTFPGNKPGPFTTPDLVYYNPAEQQVELNWLASRVGVAPNPPFFPNPIVNQQPANWPANNSLCRIQVRRWKGFQVLQGRWAAQVVPVQPVVAPAPAYGLALRILRVCRAPQTSKMPFVSPIAWGPWFPGQYANPAFAPPGNGQNVPSSQWPIIYQAGQFQFVEAKKLGKNFGEERGRQRNRPT